MGASEGEATAVSSETTRTDRSSPGAEAPAVPLAARISRYVVLEPIGKGAMGSVYAAYDPQLDRRVALKLIRTRTSSSSQDVNERRLLREAQVMAKLSHPNVVHVYDAGRSDQGVFIAMELVQGATLRAWTTAERTWRERLDAFVQAGRGLLAAHEAGLVHRDFKPDNALVDDNDRVRVLDFGLALPSNETGDDDSHGGSGPEFMGSEQLTRTGTVVGTPAYMSPEQFAGRKVDARTDQFSFCVALLEAVEGRRPFEGEKFATVAAAVTQGRVLPAPKRQIGPGWIRSVALRGLAVDPNERYPSMRELLAALEARARRRRWTMGAAVLGLAATGTTALGVYGSERNGPCDGASDTIDEVWNAARAAEVEQAFAATEARFAEAAWFAVRDGLDGYSTQWKQMREEACVSALVERAQSELQLDRRVRCLDRRRRDFSGVVDVLAGADASLLPHATDVVEGLRPIERCADLEALALEVEPPSDPDDRDRVAELRDDLDRVRALRLAGRPAEAATLVQAAVDQAQLVDHAPLLAEALYWRGTVASDAGRFEDSRRDLIEAAAHAQASGHTDYLVSTFTGLIWTAEGRADEGLVEMWERWGRAVIERRAGDPVALGNLELALGVFYGELGQLQRAYDHTKAALAVRREDTRQNVAMTLNNLGEVSRRLGRYDEAERHATEALEIRRGLLGERHPEVAMSLLNLGNISRFRGDDAKATELYGKALAVYDEAPGPGSLESAAAHNNLGLLATEAGDTGAAVTHLERALEIRESKLGHESPALISTLANLGRAYVDVDNTDRALELTRRAMTVAERELGEKHSRLIWPLEAHAIALQATGDTEDALRYAKRAMNLATDVLPSADHPERASVVLTFARIALAHGDADAKSALEEALRIYRAIDAPAEDIEEVEALLAKATRG